MQDNKTFIPFNSIKVPLTLIFTPKEDITAFELAKILPIFFGQVIYEEDWNKLGSLQRHFQKQ